MPVFYKTGLIWSDANGMTRLLTFCTVGINPSGIIVAMEAASNGDWSTTWTGVLGAQAPSVANATYNSVLDAAILSFETAAGNIVTIRVPAPLLSDFGADQQTVDPADANVAALIVACLANLADSQGNPVVSYLGGFYNRTGRALTGGS